jgi:hypothetical protein
MVSPSPSLSLTQPQDCRASLTLLRKLLDCCPFPQAKGLLIDITRALYLRLAPHSAILSLVSFSPKRVLKRAPHQPLPSQENTIPIPSLPSVTLSETVDTKKALGHIEDMKKLESYHRKLDEYTLQYPLQDDSQRLPLSTLGAIFFDLFVFPSLRLVSTDSQTPHEVRNL